MRLHKIKHRNAALDTEKCYCINNMLWNKKKIQIIDNGKAFLAPKYYAPNHVSISVKNKLFKAGYLGERPLKAIKREHEQRQKNRKLFKRKKPSEKSQRIYKFSVMVDEFEYKLLWNFLYKDVRDPIKDRVRIRTIEEVKEDELKKKLENKIRK